MYFEIDDYRPDITPVGRAISWREGILLSIIFHLLAVIAILLFPKMFPYDAKAAQARAALLQQQRQLDDARFVFIQPRNDVPAPKPPPRAEPSDQDRVAQAPQRSPKPTNPLPFSRGNTPERVEAPPQATPPRGQGPAPDPAQGQQAPPSEARVPVPESQSAMQLPVPPTSPQNGAGGRSATPGGSLGDALRNLQRYIPREQFDNPGGDSKYGPEIQFDSKGVEFGPWLRRFIAQVKRNWFVPYSSMSLRGHVVITFNVHKDGTITDLTIVGPCPIDAFNNAAFGALSGSNPTTPLPPEYPSDRAFFTVTFFYNESPP
jgi:TonB family protein